MSGQLLPQEGESINGWKIISTFKIASSGGKQTTHCRARCPSCKEEMIRTLDNIQFVSQCRACYLKSGKDSRHVSIEEEPELSDREREEILPRPKTRRDCASVPRPCPFASCRYHLFLEVSKVGTLRLGTSYQDLEEIPPGDSCALDIAENGELTLQAVGEKMGLTRERARQIETNALISLREKIDDSPLKQELMLFLGGHRENQRDLTIHDPNPKRLTWDEWRNKFTPKEPHEPTVGNHSQLLRGWVQRADQNLASHVREALAEGNTDHKGQRVSVVHGEARSRQRRPQEPRERSPHRSAPVCHEDAHRSLPESPRGSEAKGDQLDAQRNTPGDLGELHLLQDNDAGPNAAPLMPETLPCGEAPLPSGEDAGESVGSEAPGPDMAEPRRRAPRPKKYSLDNPRPKKQPPTQCKSDLGRLAYSLRKHSEGQMLSFAAELRFSPHNARLQDSLRRYLADALASGRNNDAQRSQQFLAVLLGHEPRQRKAPNMKPQQAQQLLDLLASRPDKADLIEALAIEAGLYAPRSIPTPSAALVLDRDVKPEKNKGGRPKKTSAAEEKKRLLSQKEKDHVNELLEGKWSKNRLSKYMELPISSFYKALEGKNQVPETSIAKLMGLEVNQPQAQAAE